MINEFIIPYFKINSAPLINTEPNTEPNLTSPFDLSEATLLFILENENQYIINFKSFDNEPNSAIILSNEPEPGNSWLINKDLVTVKTIGTHISETQQQSLKTYAFKPAFEPNNEPPTPTNTNNLNGQVGNYFKYNFNYQTDIIFSQNSSDPDKYQLLFGNQFGFKSGNQKLIAQNGLDPTQFNINIYLLVNNPINNKIEQYSINLDNANVTELNDNYLLFTDIPISNNKNNLFFNNLPKDIEIKSFYTTIVSDKIAIESNTEETFTTIASVPTQPTNYSSSNNNTPVSYMFFKNSDASGIIKFGLIIYNYSAINILPENYSIIQKSNDTVIAIPYNNDSIKVQIPQNHYKGNGMWDDIFFPNFEFPDEGTNFNILSFFNNIQSSNAIFLSMTNNLSSEPKPFSLISKNYLDYWNNFEPEPDQLSFEPIEPLTMVDIGISKLQHDLQEKVIKLEEKIWYNFTKIYSNENNQLGYITRNINIINPDNLKGALLSFIFEDLDANGEPVITENKFKLSNANNDISIEPSTAEPDPPLLWVYNNIERMDEPTVPLIEPSDQILDFNFQLDDNKFSAIVPQEFKVNSPDSTKNIWIYSQDLYIKKSYFDDNKFSLIDNFIDRYEPNNPFSSLVEPALTQQQYSNCTIKIVVETSSNPQTNNTLAYNVTFFTFYEFTDNPFDKAELDAGIYVKYSNPVFNKEKSTISDLLSNNDPNSEGFKVYTFKSIEILHGSISLNLDYAPLQYKTSSTEDNEDESIYFMNGPINTIYTSSLKNVSFDKTGDDFKNSYPNPIIKPSLVDNMKFEIYDYNGKKTDVLFKSPQYQKCRTDFKSGWNFNNSKSTLTQLDNNEPVYKDFWMFSDISYADQTNASGDYQTVDIDAGLVSTASRIIITFIDKNKNNEEDSPYTLKDSSGPGVNKVPSCKKNLMPTSLNQQTRKIKTFFNFEPISTFEPNNSATINLSFSEPNSWKLLELYDTPILNKEKNEVNKPPTYYLRKSEYLNLLDSNSPNEPFGAALNNAIFYLEDTKSNQYKIVLPPAVNIGVSNHEPSEPNFLNYEPCDSIEATLTSEPNTEPPSPETQITKFEIQFEPSSYQHEPKSLFIASNNTLRYGNDILYQAAGVFPNSPPTNDLGIFFIYDDYLYISDIAMNQVYLFNSEYEPATTGEPINPSNSFFGNPINMNNSDNLRGLVLQFGFVNTYTNDPPLFPAYSALPVSLFPPLKFNSNGEQFQVNSLKDIIKNNEPILFFSPYDNYLASYYQDVLEAFPGLSQIFNEPENPTTQFFATWQYPFFGNTGGITDQSLLENTYVGFLSLNNIAKFSQVGGGVLANSDPNNIYRLTASPSKALPNLPGVPVDEVEKYIASYQAGQNYWLSSGWFTDAPIAFAPGPDAIPEPNKKYWRWKLEDIEFKTPDWAENNGYGNFFQTYPQYQEPYSTSEPWILQMTDDFGFFGQDTYLVDYPFINTICPFNSIRAVKDTSQPFNPRDWYSS